MAIAVQDSQTPRCLGCDYPLLSLPENRCPECGRSFDPADPRTMRTSGSPGKVVQFLLTPPGWPMFISVGVATLFSIVAGAAPGGYSIVEVIAFMSWLGAAVCWLFRVVLYSILTSSYENTWQISDRTLKRWLVMPLTLIITIALLVGHVPLYVAFWLSRSSMEALAKEVVNGSKSNPPAQWVGLFRVQNITNTETGMRFIVSHSGFLDRGGFEWSATALPEEGSEKRSHLGGPWYTWIDDF